MITVNIATYNQLDNLKFIFEALQRQTYRDFEVIVCDDGSSDGTKEYMEELCKVEDIKYFWQEDKGFRLAKSKNNGIRAAEGEYFLSLEADVIPHHKLLEEYSLWLRPNRVIYGVRHDIEELPSSLDYEVLDEAIVDKDWRMDVLNNLSLEEKPWRHCSGCNALFPTEVLREVGGWNEEFTAYGCDDYEVCARLYAAGCEFIALPSAYGYHIKHKVSGSPNFPLLEKTERELGLI